MNMGHASDFIGASIFHLDVHYVSMRRVGALQISIMIIIITP